MGYKSLVDKNVYRAFILLKDLATQAVFVKKSGASFDFSTANTKFSSSTEVSTLAVVTDLMKSSEGRNTKKKTLMVKTVEIGDITMYDAVKLGEERWNIGPLIRDSGYVTVIEISKEG